jgi:LacI family transcriptional regulator
MAMEETSIAMPLVRAALGSDRDLTAGAFAKLRLVIGSEDFHLGNRIGIQRDMDGSITSGSRGHRGSSDTEYRWKGILRAAAQLGIEVRPALTIQLQRDVENPGPSVPEEGYVTAQELLATGEPFTALFAFNDISAIGAVRAFCDAGLRVPEDISVVGFDDIQAAAYLTPRLTTVRQPLRQMGEMAAKQLLMRISKDNGKVPQLISLAPELVVRESTGPARVL